ENDLGYMDIEAHSFTSACYNILKAGYKGINGTLCIIDEVADIMLSCTGYADDLAQCTVAIPDDVKAIAKNAADMVTISKSIIHLKSELCVEKSSSSWVMNGLECTEKLLEATMTLVQRMELIIRQSASLPKDTASCYVNATHKVVNACNAFVPNIKTCIA
ncbi:hypothetical protein KR009_006862, partial [Drosophila setifemur]